MKSAASLEELVIYEMPVKFCGRLKEDADGKKGKDYHKIQHIRSVSIDRLFNLVWDDLPS